jgi:hypothetical protein
MVDNPNLAAILDAAPTGLEKPPPMPVGLYVTQIMGQPLYDKSKKKQTEFVQFTHKFLQTADNNIDQEELSKVLGERALTDITMKYTFYLTEPSIWRLNQYLQDLGFPLDGSQSRREMIEETPGKTVTVSVIHEPSDDGQSVFAKIGSTVTDVS